MKDDTEYNSQALNSPIATIPVHVGLDVHQDTIAVAVVLWGPVIGHRCGWHRAVV